jgi:hypothetical protein
MLDAEFSSIEDDCTFKALAKRFAICDKAVQKIGEMSSQSAAPGA